GAERLGRRGSRLSGPADARLARRTGAGRARQDSGRGGGQGGASRLQAGESPERQALLVGRDVDFDLVAAREVADQDLLREGILDVLLNRALERPRAVVLVVAVIHEEVARRRRQPQRELLLAQAL